MNHSGFCLVSPAIIRRSTSLLLFLIATTTILGQDRQELESERNVILRKIKSAQSSLEAVQKSKILQLKELTLLESKMQGRKALLDNFENSIIEAEKAIKHNQLQVQTNKAQLITLQEQYKTLLRMAYLKKVGTNKLIYILSVKTLNQAFIRWRYMVQFEQYCETKAKEIQAINLKIQDQIRQIEIDKSNQSALLSDQNDQIQELEIEQIQKSQLIKKISANASQLNATIAEAEKEANRLNRAIENAIAAEIEKRNTESKPAAVITLSEKFSENKGKFSWPIKNGVVSSRFGIRKHPSLENVKINNNGIDVDSDPGSDIQVIHDGKVIGIAQVPGYNHMIIIQHGNYYTVYSKIDKVLVKKDQQLSAGDIIGTLSKDNRTLHFEIWQKKKKVNPEVWLGKND